MKAVYSDGDPEKKRKKKKDSSVGVIDTSNDGIKGSCEAGNLRACKSKAAKVKPFSHKKKRLKGRLVKSKEEKNEQPIENSSGRHANPRFL